MSGEVVITVVMGVSAILTSVAVDVSVAVYRVSVAVVWVMVVVQVATLLHAAEIFLGNQVATRAGVDSSRFFTGSCASTVVVLVSVATTTVVNAAETAVLVTVTVGGVDVEVSVVVVRARIETVAAVCTVSFGGTYPI